MGPAGTEVVVLLTSEVVTNAVVHAGTWVDVAVRRTDGGVQVEVTDRRKDMPVVVDNSGRGLRFVAALSEDWGVIPTVAGKTVWFRCHNDRPEMRLAGSTGSAV
jgi:anti-sigma regulatory factor (Ser/Thr protein kinase)